MMNNIIKFFQSKINERFFVIKVILFFITSYIISITIIGILVFIFIYMLLFPFIFIS